MKKPIQVCLAVSIVFAFTACSPADSKVPDGTSTAKLDPSIGSISLPLDDYSVTKEQFLLIDRANNLLLEDCVTAAGQPMVPAETTAAIGDDRRFGIWVPEFAEKYGYDPVPELTKIGYASGVQDTTKESIETFEGCKEKMSQELLPVLLPNLAGTSSPVQKGLDESKSQAAASSDWKQAREDWFECQEANGLKPRRADNQWGPELPDDREGQIRIASQDVACKTEVRLVQRLGDVLARFQSEYIGKNHAALIAEQKKRDEVLAKADQVVSSYGS